MAGTGGRRPGSGRKPKAIKAAAASFASEVIRKAGGYQKLWSQFLECDDPKIRLDAIKFLTNHDVGLPVQKLEHSGDGGGPIRLVLEGLQGAGWLKPNES